jgi:hypothetical protein
MGNILGSEKLMHWLSEILKKRLLRRQSRREGDNTKTYDKEEGMRTARSHIRDPDQSRLSGERNAL